LFNAYGPTESTVCATVASCSDGSQKPPIGRPIANTQIYILDRHLQPVPIGVPGELHISGVGLARGYLNLPELTASKFIPNPFDNSKFKIQNSKLYKTGDLARYLRDGNIEFLGRIDNQVKIRGFRIELGEIENVLTGHPEVREAVVIAREEKSGDKQLVAYVVPKLEKPLPSTLLGFLKQKLPDYMIPAAFVVLESLPLNPNGKLDRRALPSPDKSSYLETSFVPPRDALESELAQIWSSLLDVHPVGVTDNFFAVGGHSLLAIRLMAKIEQHFGKTWPLATVFQFPTIKELANLLRSTKDAPTHSCLVPIQPIGNKLPFFCIHAIGGEVFSYADLASHLGWQQPFYGLQALGLNGECRPLTRIEDMAATYIRALQTVQPDGPYQLGGWSFGGAVAFEMATQLTASGQKVSLLALFDSHAPTPAFKASLKMDEVQHLVHWTKQLSGLFGKALPVSVDELRLMGKFEERLNYVLKQAKIARIFPPEIRLEQVQQRFEVWKANSIAMRAYIPESYSGRITLWCATENSRTQNVDPTLGWGEFATGGLDIHKIDGDHFSLVRSQVLVKELKAYLNQRGDGS
jgi:thioesterase domain-containing protein/acyl carrier protein